MILVGVASLRYLIRDVGDHAVDTEVVVDVKEGGEVYVGREACLNQVGEANGVEGEEEHLKDGAVSLEDSGDEIIYTSGV